MRTRGLNKTVGTSLEVGAVVRIRTQRQLGTFTVTEVIQKRVGGSLFEMYRLDDMNYRYARADLETL